ncbi:biotin transporter BioY [Desulfotomaculum varum]
MRLSARDISLAALFASLTSVGAFIKVPIPHVPFTLQWLFVILSGLLLGSRLGLFSQLVYICIGLLGVPVFAYGGGFSYVLQPTFGYLVGFAVAAWLIGRMAEKNPTATPAKLFLYNFYGLAVVYGLGVSHLYLIKNFILHLHFPLSYAIWFGALVCLPGDIALCVVAALLTKKIRLRLRPILRPIIKIVPQQEVKKCE